MPGSAQPPAGDSDPRPGSEADVLPDAGLLSLQGLSWSWELDLETVQAALNEPAPWNRPRHRDREDDASQDHAAPEASADRDSANRDQTDRESADRDLADKDPAGKDPAEPGDPAHGPADPLPEDDDPDVLLEELIEATLDERTREVPIAAVAGRVAEALPPSPDLAGWLATTSPEGLDSGALPGVAASFRRLASWAQAGELAAVAQMASRSAAADDKIGTDEQGRPARISDEAAAQVSLALAMTRYGACWWTDLAVTLSWRLAATGAALAAGRIDLARAQLIAEATAGLNDEKARVVEARVLDKAGDQTMSQLRSRLRRAVIAADPEGAEQRRQESERRARVLLYADDEGTATLAGQSLPGTRATAAMARISAMARALKASGATGGMDLLRAQVFIGLLLGTLPGIPPAPDGPPGEEPPTADDDDGRPGPRGSDSGDSSTSGNGAGGRSPGDGSADDAGRGGAGTGNSGAGSSGTGSSGARRGSTDTAGTGTAGTGTGDAGTGNAGTGDAGTGRPGRPPGPRGPQPARSRRAPGPAPRGSQPGSAGPPGSAGLPDSGCPPGAEHAPGSAPPASAQQPPGSAWPTGADGPSGPPGSARPPNSSSSDVPAPSDRDAPSDDSLGDPLGGDPAWATSTGEELDADADEAALPPLTSLSWAALPVLTGSPRAGPEPGPDPPSGHPPPGLLDLTLPWQTLAGSSSEPGYLGRLGPVTPVQACEIADAAAADPAVSWRVILTSRSGQAIAVTRVPRTRLPSVPVSPGLGLVGRVTLTVPEDVLNAQPRLPARVATRGSILDRALRAAGRAAAAAATRAAADAVASGGCAHTTANPGYRPASRLREYVVARDLTCRFPSCGQPAWRGDLDHTRPWDQGGLTCSCNLGGLCRHHHILKQHPGWQLTQATPGTFTWLTSAGRAYGAIPDSHAA